MVILFFPERIERVHVVHAAVALVTLVLVAQLFVGIAHTLLRRKAERVEFQGFLAFRDTFLEFTLLEKNHRTDQHGGNIVRVESQSTIHTGKRGFQVARLTFQVGNPGECLGPVLLANALFQGI